MIKNDTVERLTIRKIVVLSIIFQNSNNCIWLIFDTTRLDSAHHIKTSSPAYKKEL